MYRCPAAKLTPRGMATDTLVPGPGPPTPPAMVEMVPVTLGAPRAAEGAARTGAPPAVSSAAETDTARTAPGTPMPGPRRNCRAIIGVTPALCLARPPRSGEKGGRAAIPDQTCWHSPQLSARQATSDRPARERFAEPGGSGDGNGLPRVSWLWQRPQQCRC